LRQHSHVPALLKSEIKTLTIRFPELLNDDVDVLSVRPIGGVQCQPQLFDLEFSTVFFDLTQIYPRSLFQMGHLFFLGNSHRWAVISGPKKAIDVLHNIFPYKRLFYAYCGERRDTSSL
jgi:hypothetical protein